MLPEFLRFLPSPYAAIDFATDVRICFIRRRKPFKKLMELDHFKLNPFTEIQSGMDDLKDRRGYSHLKEEALDRTMWRNRFRGGFGPVIRQNTE